MSAGVRSNQGAVERTSSAAAEALDAAGAIKAVVALEC